MISPLWAEHHGEMSDGPTFLTTLNSLFTSSHCDGDTHRLCANKPLFSHQTSRRGLAIWGAGPATKKYFWRTETWPQCQKYPKVYENLSTCGANGMFLFSKHVTNWFYGGLSKVSFQPVISLGRLLFFNKTNNDLVLNSDIIELCIELNCVLLLSFPPQLSASLSLSLSLSHSISMPFILPWRHSK